MNFAKGLMPYDVISFDVFDTLLFRPFSNPSDLFMLVGEKLDIMNFTEIRIQAEEEARRKNQLLRGNREVTLKEIYELVAQETGIDPKAGADLEFSLEYELCYPNSYMQEVFISWPLKERPWWPCPICICPGNSFLVSFPPKAMKILTVLWCPVTITVPKETAACMRC